MAFGERSLSRAQCLVVAYVQRPRCIDCARAIVQSGIVRVLSPEPALEDPVWGQSFLRSRVILEEGGVEMILRPE